MRAGVTLHKKKLAGWGPSIRWLAPRPGAFLVAHPFGARPPTLDGGEAAAPSEVDAVWGGRAAPPLLAEPAAGATITPVPFCGWGCTQWVGGRTLH